MVRYLEQFWTLTSEYANFKRDVQKILDIVRQNAFGMWCKKNGVEYIQGLNGVVKYNFTQKDIDMFNASEANYVLESPLFPGQPLSNNFFRDGVSKELSNLGITKTQQRERVLTCHSLRHTFITLAQLSGISDVEIRALAGHKSAKVMNRYSHVPHKTEEILPIESCEAGSFRPMPKTLGIFTFRFLKW